MTKIEIFDPPMCCPTGVCGPSIDPALVQFAADVDWLKKKGVPIERYNLAQQPSAFAENKCVREELTKEGNDCLPLILGNGMIVWRKTYPNRKELANYLGLELTPEDLEETEKKESAFTIIS